VRKVRLYKNTGHIVADIYPVGKPLVDSLACNPHAGHNTTSNASSLSYQGDTLSSNSNRLTPLANDDKDDDDDEQESTVRAPFAVRNVPRVPIAATLEPYGPAYRTYYSAPLRAQRAKLRHTLRQKLLQQERHALSTVTANSNCGWLEQVVPPRPKIQLPPSICPCDFQMKRAAAINKFINLRAFCAIVDSLVAKDVSPKSSHSEVLEQLAYQGSMQDDDGKKLLYRQLVAGPDSTDWLDHSAQEWDRLIEKTKTLAFVPVSRKPKDKKATYIKQKCTEKVKPPALEPEKRVRATAGGDKVDYGGDTAAYTAGLKTVKTLWNSVLSTINARFMTIDIKDFYLHTRLESPEYAWVSLAQIPPATQAKYHVENLVVNGKVLVEITGGIYGLFQSGLLAQKDLIKLLEANGYYMTTTNCLFRHRTRDIYFSLIVDDFGFKYTKEEDVNHLVGVLGTKYKTHIDWSGTRFLGITLDWDYTSPIRSVTTSMPDFVIKALKRYGYDFSQPPALSPGGWIRPQYGVKQQMVAVDNSPPLSADESIRLMSIIGTFLWYCRVLDYTGLVALGRLGQEVAHPTKVLLD
jgi:hypothetical protein